MKTAGWQLTLYQSSPEWFQNIMVSAYGWKRQRQRYGGDWHQWVEYYLQSQYWTIEEFAAYQLQHLRTLVTHAMEHVPYYQEVYSQLGVVPEELVDVKQLPILEKDTLRTEMDRCIAGCWPRDQLRETHTSGSTGTPLTYFSHINDFRQRMALLERQRRWAGVKEGDRVVTFGGNLIVSKQSWNYTPWRYNFFGRQMLVSSYHLSLDNLPRIVSKMAEFRPRILEGYPSALYVVARWILDHGLPPNLQPVAILATAETLHDYQRATIEGAFGVPVYNYYGSSESAPLITQHPDGSLYANPESGIFEFLRPDGSDAAPGEVGEMVVTGFHTKAMPLIRYRIRDAAVLDNPVYTVDGLQMPRVRTIIGRLDDMIYTSDRGWIGRLSQAVKVFPGSIREAQLIQQQIDELIVRLVVDPDRFNESHLTPLFADLRQRIGEVTEIKIEYVDKIPRGANNKFKYVVCDLPPEQKDALQLHTHLESVE